jgi:hypothetical protein
MLKMQTIKKLLKKYGLIIGGAIGSVAILLVFMHFLPIEEIRAGHLPIVCLSSLPIISALLYKMNKNEK